MFTGLVQDIGTLCTVTPSGESVHLAIATQLVSEFKIGDSLCVNGVCLTIVATEGPIVTLTAIPETLDRTTLGRLPKGAEVHLEPALRLSDRLGGHWVQGHVDGVGRIGSRLPRDGSIELTIAPPPVLMKYIAPKGSVALDGVSLTVSKVMASTFAVALIPHTLSVTTLAQRRVGDELNIEVDILAKYMDHLLNRTGPQRPLTEDWLRENGF